MGLVVGGIILYTAFVPKTTNIVNEEPEVVTEIVTVEQDALENAIKQAQEAKKKEIETIAQSAYDETYKQEMKKVELEVVTNFNKEIDARQIELEKETKVY